MSRLRTASRRLRPVAGAVGEGVVLPVGAYLALIALGSSDTVALTGSAAAAVVLLGVGWLRTRTLNTLGVLVLVRFTLSLALLGVTDDARWLLVKDAAITAVIGLGMLTTLATRHPFITRVQRDLSGDPDAHRRRLTVDPGLRRLYRRLTLLWGVCLVAEPVGEVVLVLSTSLTTAVVLCNLIGTAVILGLIALTQVSAARHGRAAGPHAHLTP